jgi:hypothetical protein
LAPPPSSLFSLECAQKGKPGFQVRQINMQKGSIESDLAFTNGKAVLPVGEELQLRG